MKLSQNTVYTCCAICIILCTNLLIGAVTSIYRKFRQEKCSENDFILISEKISFECS